MQQPTLRTDRLRLRPFSLDDAEAVAELAGEREVAPNTETIPHPYPQDEATEWIDGLEGKREEDGELVFAVTLEASGELVGAAGLDTEPEHDRAALGYWIGKPYWDRGYATEAARRVVRFGFEELGLHRIYARCFARNPASARVLEKIGMRREGRLREHFQKWGEREDVEVYGLLASEAS